MLCLGLKLKIEWTEFGNEMRQVLVSSGNEGERPRSQSDEEEGMRTEKMAQPGNCYSISMGSATHPTS